MGCVYFNNTLFTENSVPFQLSDDEEIFYFNRETQFYLRMGNGIPAETEIYKSASGYVFVTQYRLIYKVSDSENSFRSFCIPLREIAAIGEDQTIDFVYGTFVHSLHLSFGDAQRSVFFAVLQDLLGSFSKLSLSGNDDGDSLPFYSDLCK